MYSNHDKLFQNAFQFAAIGMALVGLDGRWLQVNRAVCELVGYTEEELLNALLSGHHPSRRSGARSFLRGAAPGRRSAPLTRWRSAISTRTARIIWVLLHVAIVRDEEGKPQAFISQIIDITARKVAEEELERSSQANQRLIAELRERNSQIEHAAQPAPHRLRLDQADFLRWPVDDRRPLPDRYLHLNLTHTISEEAYEQVVAEVDAAIKRKATE